MKFKMTYVTTALLEAGAVMALAACGGGSDGAPVDNVTAAAVDSVQRAESVRAQRTAPSVTITSNSGAGTSSLTLSGTASDLQALARLEWSNDRGGSGVASTDGLADGTWVVSGNAAKLAWSANKIPLKSGANNITVTATNSSGKIGTATVTIAGAAARGAVVPTPAPKPTPAPTPAPAPAPTPTPAPAPAPTPTPAPAPAPAPSPAPAPAPPASSTISSLDLCNGLVQDKAAHPMTTVAKPAVGQSYVDPQFGTTIRRVSDSASGKWAVAAPMYSTVQAWNADESYLILYQTGGSASAGHHLYDGKTYAHIKALDINPSDLEQVYWDTANPKILYYAEASSHKLRKFNVDTDTQASAAVLHDFSTAPTNCSASEALSGGSDPMWTSWNSTNIGLVCGKKAFSYNLATNTVGTVLNVSAGGNAPQASPSGALYFLNNNSTAANVLDVNMNLLRSLSLSPDEHASMGTADGRDTFFSVQFDGSTTGTLVAANMGDGSMRVLIGESTGYPYPPGGTHVSAIAYRNPGWVAATIVGEAASNGKMGQNVLDNEVVLANANTGGSVCRVAHHHSCGSSDSCAKVGYFAEPHPVISPTGTRILYGSDWDGGTSVDAYIVELPGYKR